MIHFSLLVNMATRREPHRDKHKQINQGGPTWTGPREPVTIQEYIKTRRWTPPVSERVARRDHHYLGLGWTRASSPNLGLLLPPPPPPPTPSRFLMAAAAASSSSSSAAATPQGVTERRGIPAASFVEDVETYLRQAGLDVNSGLAFLQERYR